VCSAVVSILPVDFAALVDHCVCYARSEEGEAVGWAVNPAQTARSHPHRDRPSLRLRIARSRSLWSRLSDVRVCLGIVMGIDHGFGVVVAAADSQHEDGNADDVDVAAGIDDAENVVGTTAAAAEAQAATAHSRNMSDSAADRNTCPYPHSYPSPFQRSYSNQT
jgi:hypothetical protein